MSSVREETKQRLVIVIKFQPDISIYGYLRFSDLEFMIYHFISDFSSLSIDENLRVPCHGTFLTYFAAKNRSKRVT